MVSATLTAGTAMAAVAGLLFLFIAYLIGQRPAAGERAFARTAFAFWAFAMGLHSLSSASSSFLAALGWIDVAGYAAFSFVNVALISLALWGISYYFAYLLTGKESAWIPLAFLYAGVYIYLVYFLAASDPSGLRIGRWRASLVFENRLPTAFTQAAVALVTVPQALGALVYTTLFKRLNSRTQRYRVVLISASTFLWSASIFFASTARFARLDTFQIANRVMLLAAGAAILAAYMPPKWIRKRYSIDSIKEPAPEATGG